MGLGTDTKTGGDTLSAKPGLVKGSLFQESRLTLTERTQKGTVPSVAGLDFEGQLEQTGEHILRHCLDLHNKALLPLVESTATF